MHVNDYPPNSFLGGKLLLYYCFVCDKPNFPSWVESGRCYHCHWPEPTKEPTT